MLIAFQIVLLIVILLTVLGTITENDKSTRDNLTALSIAALIACVVSFISV